MFANFYWYLKKWKVIVYHNMITWYVECRHVIWHSYFEKIQKGIKIHFWAINCWCLCYYISYRRFEKLNFFYGLGLGNRKKKWSKISVGKMGRITIIVSLIKFYYMNSYWKWSTYLYIIILGVLEIIISNVFIIYDWMAIINKYLIK